MNTALPTGTVTFLFTDMEGSTRLAQELGDAWAGLMSDHDDLVRDAVVANGGVEVRTEGDAFFAAFESAIDAAASTVAIQRAITGHPWPDGVDVKVRCGLHTGIGALGGADYVGIDVHRAARVSSAAHGGQILLSEATATLVEGTLPEETRLRDLGKHRLKDLQDADTLFQIVVPGVSDEFPALRTLEAVPNNLPVQVTSFVGREDEVVQVSDLLASKRIVTLLGPGGTGKTRLSLQVGAEVAEEFSDGVYFVSLAPVDDAELIATTVLSALGIQVSAKRSPRERLLEFLSDRQLLLLLDNFEQLVEDGAELVSAMAHAAPAVKFLVTSRIPLRVSGEQELAIAPLDQADPSMTVTELSQIESVHLFLERAAAVRPDFALDEENAPHVAGLVNRLDGLPLAIELVVPKLKLLSVESILERLDTQALKGGARDAPERHQSMWNAIAWSEETLPEAVQRLFCRMSVFVGDARLAEIEEVCGPSDELGIEVLEGLAVLVDHSLVRTDEGSGRFRMLHVIREFAAQRLAGSGAEEEMRERHASVYLERIETVAPKLLGKGRKALLEELDHDLENLRAAMTWAIDGGHTDMALRFTWSLWRYWQIRALLLEAQQRVDAALALPGGEPARRAKAIEALGGIRWWAGDGEACLKAYEKALEMQREIGDSKEIANALYNYGLTVAFYGEDVEGGVSMLREAEERYEGLGDQSGLADVHWALGNVQIFALEMPEESIANLERSVEGYRAAGNVFGEGWALFELGETHRRLGHYDEARRFFTEGLTLLYGTGELSACVLFMMTFAALARDLGNLERAYRLAGAGWGMADRTGVELIGVAMNRVEGFHRSELDLLEGEERQWYEEGRTLSFEDAVAFAVDSDDD